MYVCTETPPQAGLMFTYLPYIYYYTGRWKVVSDLGWCDCGDCFVTCGGSGTCLQLRYTYYVAYFNAETTSSLVHSSCILNTISLDITQEAFKTLRSTHQSFSRMRKQETFTSLKKQLPRISSYLGVITSYSSQNFKTLRSILPSSHTNNKHLKIQSL